MGLPTRTLWLPMSFRSATQNVLGVFQSRDSQRAARLLQSHHTPHTYPEWCWWCRFGISPLYTLIILLITQPSPYPSSSTTTTTTTTVVVVVVVEAG